MFSVTICLGPFTRNGDVFFSKGMINNHYGQPTDYPINQPTNRPTEQPSTLNIFNSCKGHRNKQKIITCGSAAFFVHDMISFKIIPKAQNSLPKVCFMLTYLFTNLVIIYSQNGKKCSPDPFMQSYKHGYKHSVSISLLK